MQLSGRFKHAVKTALAITMAYGFALWFDWSKPMWAAFAVALISLPTLEASLGKGGQRLWGTLLASIMALTLIALFPQDRWLFLTAIASWLAFCTYQMSGGRNAYLWFCAGFVCSIIAANGGPNPTEAFTVAVIRTLETALGIICFAVVFSLLWPVRADVSATPAEPPPAPDTVERLNRAARVFLVYCSGFLLVIFVPGFPGSYSFLGMLAPLAIIITNTPQMPPQLLVKPVALSMLFASPVYMFVMPMLDSFYQLGPVIFLACFVIAYSLHTPQAALGRTLGLAFFAVVTGIENQQSYSFLSLANTALMFFSVLLLIYLGSGIQIFAAGKNDMVAANAETD